MVTPAVDLFGLVGCGISAANSMPAGFGSDSFVNCCGACVGAWGVAGVSAGIFVTSISSLTGSSTFSDGEYSVAAENYEKRVKIAHRLKDDVAEARALGNLANAIGRLQTARGIELYKECIALAQKVHDVQVSFET